ncbi:MAG TPA: universal stress protein [Acidimicrobiales bacterium]|nr:universal stress protein [Acidimicrobiales bacterium]
MFETVVVGADDSQTALQAVIAATEIARMTGGALHIVTAYEPKAVKIDHVPAEFRHSSSSHPADILLDGLSRIVEQKGLKPVVHAASGDPADAIVGLAEQVGADLIVVGNRGMKGVRRVLGSVPNTVAHAAHCSVLIFDTEASG